MTTRSEFIVTATPELLKSAVEELKEVASELRRTRTFANGVFLVETQMPTGGFTEALIQLDPIFVKHIMPVQAKLELTGQKEIDLPAILESARDTCIVCTGDKFSVQCRRVGPEYDYNAKDVEVFVGSFFETEKEAVPTFSDTKVRADDSQKIISVYLFLGSGYIGCSTVRENLNEHSDEYRVFSRHMGREICRSEFKLAEAIRKFGLEISQGRALDLGAAPGGWTKVLADAGMEVVAVDPAKLDERVARLPTVTHIRSKAEDYVCDGAFDLLVNDMNIDPQESAEMMVKMAHCLRPGAFAIMTVKLVSRNPRKLLDPIMPILDLAYSVLRVKHLFHNRREVTALLKRKD